MAFNEQIVQLVWQMGIIVPGYNPLVIRKDRYGKWIQRNQYGDRNAQYGWEIDHIIPVVKGGSDSLSNLQPLHWENNVQKQDKRLF